MFVPLYFTELPAVLAKLESYVDQLPAASIQPVNLPQTPKVKKNPVSKPGSWSTNEASEPETPTNPQSLPTKETKKPDTSSTSKSHLSFLTPGPQTNGSTDDVRKVSS